MANDHLGRRAVVAGGASLIALAGLPARAAGRGRAFPSSFVWGAATAGHQVEGNNINSDVWVAEHTRPTVYAEPSGDAANSFDLWPVDLQLVKSLGLNSYRFSLEWARIETEPGVFSNAMLDHYKRMVETCRKQDIRPIVTFNHFTTPAWFAARSGWLNPEAPALFGRFCDRAARHLASAIDHAVTLNEPNLQGVLQDVLPAGLFAADKAMNEAAARKLGVERFLPANALEQPDWATAQQHLREGHSLGRAAIKAVRSDLPVGVSLAVLDEQEAEPHSLQGAVRERLYGPWLRHVRGDDFLGVQNYERRLWGAKGTLPGPADAKRTTLGSEVYPPSLAGAVRYCHSVAQTPILVTEHGVGTDDDRIRAWLIPAALDELKKLMDEGVPVKGYCHWSLIDNFEWAFGYKIRYGLHSLDRQTFERTPKPSALVYREYIRANRAAA